jgi:hypothetical protein
VLAGGLSCDRLLSLPDIALLGSLEEREPDDMSQANATFGGCFAFRPKRTGVKLSAHSWGIAIDLNIVNNAQGSPGDTDTGLIDIFRENGFEWGGDWSGKTHDPMHFQFCSGY